MTKLSEKLFLKRIDRPDEWSMDDYSREAKKLEDKIIAFQKREVEPISLNQFEHAFYKACSGNISDLHEWLTEWGHLAIEDINNE